MRQFGGRIGLLVLGALLLVGAMGYVGGGLWLYHRYQLASGNYQVDPAAACGVQITWNPPSDIYTAFYANQPSLLDVRYSSTAPQTLQFTVSIAQLTQAQTVAVHGGPTFQMQTFKPPLLGSGVLDALVGPQYRDSQLLMSIRSGSNHECQLSHAVRLHSRQTMLWTSPTGADLSRYLAGWVTPQSAVINALVYSAGNRLSHDPTAYTAATAMYGYNDGQASAQAVIDQVNAIFDTLQYDPQYQVHYAGEISTQQDSTEIIRLPADVLGTPSHTAMCVETTAIMASAAERIGLRPYIIIVPHHAFLGVALGPTPSAPLAYWETSDLNGGVNGDQANIHGDSEYNQKQQQGQILRVIDIEQQRQQGIAPIE